jgi:hypothetical protein
MPRSRRTALALTLLALGAAAPASVSGQAVEPREPVERTELGGRLHFQWNTTSAEDEVSSDLFVRRARIWVATRFNDWIDGVVHVDVAGAGAVARYAFVRLSPSPVARFSFGQFKRAFDLFELTASSQILVVERDGNVRGVIPCAGIGGVCSYSRFSEKLQLSSLDVGVLVDGELAGGRLGYLVSVTNGSGPNTREDNDAKSVAGRVEWLPRADLRLGANASVHDYSNPVTLTDAHAPSVSFDVEVGNFEQGLHVQAGVLSGRNWMNLDDDGDESRYLAWQGITTYRIPVSEHGKIRALEPLGRISWGDPDRDAGSDGGLLLTPGLVVHFEGRNKVAANVDLWHPQAGETIWGLKVQTYLHF